ncbi:MAG: GNAT family N-acetyltransferase [bacterium]|nr:GNAT family N-acetyltransferase [bacterium]
MGHFRKLVHKKETEAGQIYGLFQASYPIEAELMGVTDFPPLNRGVKDILNSSTRFFGSVQGNTLVAAIEIDQIEDRKFNIDSLVVSPGCFRQGLGSRLLSWTLEELAWQAVTVSTASANIPAIRLYQKLGFRLFNERRVDENIIIVTLILEYIEQFPR